MIFLTSLENILPIILIIALGFFSKCGAGFLTSSAAIFPN